MIKKVQKLHKDLKEQQKKLPKKYVKSGINRFLDDNEEPRKRLSPLKGFKDQPLLSLEESLQQITHIIPDLQTYIDIAMRESKDPTDGLTQNELAAIQIYTMRFSEEQNSIYLLLNQDLRSESRNGLKKWFPYLKLFLQALNKLPSYTGTVWRGARVDTTQQYKVGQTGIWWGASSATITTSILERSDFMGQNGSRTLFSIECVNGKCIEKYSYFHSEGEVLLLPGFSYEVTSHLYAGDGLHIIGLKEIEHDLH
jgi:hypothetical protein